MPVTFPTGLAMLDTRPDAMGSLPVKKTIGIVFVAAFAARGGNNRYSAVDKVRGQSRQSIVIAVRSAMFDFDVGIRAAFS
jgi:hypothetical protein